jgi:hypothetical protein
VKVGAARFQHSLPAPEDRIRKVRSKRVGFMKREPKPGQPEKAAEAEDRKEKEGETPIE